jgi:Protein of unknown function (DUF2924)
MAVGVPPQGAQPPAPASSLPRDRLPLQSECLGDLDRDTQRFLDRVAAGAMGNELPTSGYRCHALRPGTVLVREWDGKSQRVTVLDRGVAWNGATYRSLTEVAFAITGTRWSGPRFFGLRSRPEKRS